jgi:hypothetical protein
MNKESVGHPQLPRHVWRHQGVKGTAVISGWARNMESCYYVANIDCISSL